MDLTHYLSALFATLILLASAAQLDAAVIDFDTLSDGDVVTNQFPEATFSSEAGFVNRVTARDLGSSLPNFICTYENDVIDCVHDSILDFTNPVNNLTLLGVGVNDAGVVANVNVFENNVFSASVAVIGVADPETPVPVNLSGFSNVTRIEIDSIVDLGGIGWDDFTFDVVPEPSLFILLVNRGGE